jgi:short-subunit dehydrogenase
MKFFITGISSGIGRALAEQLLIRGDEVWGLARRTEKLEELKKSNRDSRLHTSVCDLEAPDQIDKVLGEMSSAGFLPDVVILNAGDYIKDLEGGIDYENFKRSLRVNLKSSVYIITQLLPKFLEQDGGAFITVSSTSAYRPVKGSIGYSTTKAALSMAMRSLSMNLAHTKLKFSTVHFGPIKTRLWFGKDSTMVASPDAAAKFLIKIISKSSGNYYFPFLSTTLLRLSLVLPDRLFTLISTKLLK